MAQHAAPCRTTTPSLASGAAVVLATWKENFGGKKNSEIVEAPAEGKGELMKEVGLREGRERRERHGRGSGG